MGEKCEDPHSSTKSRWGRNVKTLTHPLGWKQLLKVDGGRNVKTLTCPLGQNQLLNIHGGRNEDPHMPLWAESTTKRRWGRNVKTLTQLLKVYGGRNVKTITCPLGWNQLLKVDGWGNVKTLTCPLGQNQLLKVDGEKCEDPHTPLGVESTTKHRWGGEM